MPGLQEQIAGGKMSKLLDFMTKLGEDSEYRAQYIADPDGTMKAFGLTDAECKMIRTCDMEGIKKASGVKNIYLNIYVPPYDDNNSK
ncbi:hypothetical protein JCM17844_19190 [Iodidimonas gelatinilytica]|uniref:Extradiol ring-cleavage dioxygenase LigAB LigA subunit domain-containing protein n=1 Tax=Iodidimonas gelatinilytica TaxID=1236966 RepID=A0A5A7MQG2_9PROT|nr:hypothetical protein [Iodidimonas gelatinilytica]GEQ98282.1 hypothetical protein JCM17844_19190 [Iodidimonas gelatinilytica]